MIVLLITILLGLCFAFFATQNTTGVTLHIASYTISQIPLYLVSLGSLLIGAIIAIIINLVHDLGNFLILRKKENTIRELKKTLGELLKRVHQLEIEEAQREHNSHKKPEKDENSL